jgi:hypothetical protein
MNIWVKPFGTDILYLAVGKIVDGRFRGPGVVDDDFQMWIGGMGSNGDPVFQRFEDAGSALFISQPIPGLSLFAQIKPGFNTVNSTPGLDNPNEAADAYKKIQAGFAYDIPGIGLARAQWYGNTMDGISPVNVTTLDPEWSANNARIEAAFKLTAVKNLTLDLGLKLPIPVKEEFFGVDVTYQGNFQINAIGEYKAGDFGVAFGLYSSFAGSVAIDDPMFDERDSLQPSFRIIAVPSFYVAAIDATVGAEVGFKAEGESEVFGVGQQNEGTTFGIGAWIKRGLGKGHIKTGLAFQFPKYGNKGTIGETSYLTWPIILEIYF